MYKATVRRNFTFEKFKSHGVFKKGEIITNLTEEDKNYLLANRAIENVEEIVEAAVEPAKKEKAVKKTTRTTKKK